mgnify:FL=1
MKKILSLVLCVLMLAGVFALASCGTGGDDTSDTSKTSGASGSGESSGSAGAESSSAGTDDKEALKAELKATFLELADEVVVDDDSVTFQDASGDTPVTIRKNPQKVVNLYASFTTLWYEAGGTVVGCIGGSSSQELYKEYIGRDITEDAGMTIAATSSSGKKWDTETILALQPDLIICSTAMSGYSTIQAPAEAAGIPVIAMSYNDFSDYLKWFKVFCNLTGQPELWESVALKALDEVVEVLAEIPESDHPTVFSMFSGSESLQANTSSTVVGGMVNAMQAVNIVDGWDNSTGAERLDINLETVFAANPDIIIVQCHAGADAAREQVEELYGDNAVWQSLKAVQNDKVYYLEKTLFHNKPNSRFAEAYQKLAEILYPDVEFSFQASN